MTDYDIRKKNELTKFSLRMNVRKAERFSPEVQQIFQDLITATEYPKQKKMDDFEEESND